MRGMGGLPRTFLWRGSEHHGRMYRVLMPIDGDEERMRAQMRTAASLPGAAESVEVTLLRVFDDQERADETSVTQTVTGKRAEERLRERDISVVGESRFGDPASEILAAADELDADLVLLGGRKRSPLGSVLFGSVSQSVLLDADRPVTITGRAEATAEEAAT